MRLFLVDPSNVVAELSDETRFVVETDDGRDVMSLDVLALNQSSFQIQVGTWKDDGTWIERIRLIVEPPSPPAR